jgi:hypothetical protein
MNKFAFLLFISSVTIVFSKSKPNLVTVNTIHLMQMSFWGMILLVLYTLKQYFSKIGTRKPSYIKTLV